MDSLSIGIQVSGYFWILEKSTKFTKMWQHFLKLARKMIVYPLVSKYPWILGHLDISQII